MEFVDELADPNRDKHSALASNAVLQATQHEKWLTFSAEKCELLKINSKDDTCLKVNGRSMKQVDVACYLGDHFNCQGNNSDLCEKRVTKAKDSIIELCSLCKGINMENRQIETMLLLYKTVFIPRLIYNCETWSNLHTVHGKSWDHFCACAVGAFSDSVFPSMISRCGAIGKGRRYKWVGLSRGTTGFCPESITLPDLRQWSSNTAPQTKPPTPIRRRHCTTGLQSKCPHCSKTLTTEPPKPGNAVCQMENQT